MSFVAFRKQLGTAGMAVALGLGCAVSIGDGHAAAVAAHDVGEAPLLSFAEALRLRPMHAPTRIAYARELLAREFPPTLGDPT